MKLPPKVFKTTPVKGGKQYVEVKERLQYLSSDFEGEYSINTEYEYFESRKMWVVKATLTLEVGGVKSTYTGLAQEIESDKLSSVNFASALENAETSAVGRACGMAAIGIDISIASADEIKKAVNRRLLAEENEEKKLERATGNGVDALADAVKAMQEAPDLDTLKSLWKQHRDAYGTNPAFSIAKDQRKSELEMLRLTNE